MNEKHDDTWLWDREGVPDDDVRRLEELMAPLAHDPRTPMRIVRPASRRPLWIATAALVLIAVGAGILVLGEADDDTTPGTESPVLMVGDRRLDASSWIEAETGDVELALGDRLGRIRLERGGRLQVRRLDAEVARLFLDRGRLEASIAADVRPRFFQVETPATRCVDLGCRYTLEVDDAGNAFVHVLTGRVAFENAGKEVFVPANATCRASRDGRAGTPRFRDTPAELIAALDAFDAAGPDAPTARLQLAHAVCARVERIADTLGVWHLLGDPDPEVAVLARRTLERVAGPELDRIPTTREAWKEELQGWWY